MELFPILREKRRDLASQMSGGQQQMLALGRGLMAGPEVLLLDEPTLGLAPKVVKEVFEKVSEINERFKTTIFVVEHNIKGVLDIVDRAYVLDKGRVVHDGFTSVDTRDRHTDGGISGQSRYPARSRGGIETPPLIFPEPVLSRSRICFAKSGFPSDLSFLAGFWHLFCKKYPRSEFSSASFSSAPRPRVSGAFVLQKVVFRRQSLRPCECWAFVLQKTVSS